MDEGGDRLMDFVKGPDNPEQTNERITRLVNTYQVSLKRLCCVWLKDSALAEDAVQETFLRAYQALPGFRGDCSEKTWLMRIAVNVCRNMKRSGWFWRVDRSADIADLPLAAVPAEEKDDAVLQAILTLPARQREVVMLYYYQDMRMPEISQALHVAPSTVSRRLEAARKQLRCQLERME